MKRFYGIVSDELDILPPIQTTRFETREQAQAAAERAAKFHFGDRGQVAIGEDWVLDGDTIPEYNPGAGSILYGMVQAKAPLWGGEKKREIVRILQEQWEHYYHGGGSYTLATYAADVLAGSIELCEPMTVRELLEAVCFEEDLDFALSMDEHGFSMWGGIKVRKEFDQTIVLVGGYGGGIATLGKNFGVADLEEAIETAVGDLDVDKFGEKVLYVDRSELIK